MGSPIAALATPEVRELRDALTEWLDGSATTARLSGLGSPVIDLADVRDRLRAARRRPLTTSDSNRKERHMLKWIGGGVTRRRLAPTPLRLDAAKVFRSGFARLG